MPIVFAAMTPHPPLLLPTIGKEKTAALKKTADALTRLEEELYISKPSVIVIITPHGSLFPDAFAVNGHTDFTSSFAKFGDLTTKKQWTGAPELAAKIAHGAKTVDLQVQVSSQEEIDHGASIPLYFLTQHLPDVKVLPIGYSNLSPDLHLRFGDLIKDVVVQTDKRIAIIASGDLSHQEGKDGSAGILFDEKLRTALEEGEPDRIIALEKVAERTNECGFRSLLILLGALGHAKYRFETYAYESPFGVGYLTGNFHI